MRLIRLLNVCPDVETTGLVSVALAHLLVASSQILEDILAEGLIQRFSYAIEKLPSELELQAQLMFFMHSCLQDGI